MIAFAFLGKEKIASLVYWMADAIILSRSIIGLCFNKVLGALQIANT